MVCGPYDEVVLFEVELVGGPIESVVQGDDTQLGVYHEVPVIVTWSGRFGVIQVNGYSTTQHSEYFINRMFMSMHLHILIVNAS